MTTLLRIALATGLMVTPALGQDDQLYPTSRAPDASFLRVYAGAADIVSVAEGQALDPAENGLTPYTEIAPGAVVIRIGPTEHAIEAGASAHYTFVPPFAGGAPVLLTDAVTNAPGEADLLFYNFSDLGAVDLFVPEAEVLALSPVGAGDGAAVALRAPLTLSFVARSEGRVMAQAAAVAMRPRTGTSLVITGDGGRYTMTATPNAYAD